MAYMAEHAKSTDSVAQRQPYHSQNLPGTEDIFASRTNFSRYADNVKSSGYESEKMSVEEYFRLLTGQVLP